MGVINITPDSFSDGNKYNNKEQAIKQIYHMLADGADIIDIGGQSVYPGISRVSADEELNRIMPVLEEIRAEFGDIKISIDTFEEKVMAEVLRYNIHMINNIYAFRNISNSAILTKIAQKKTNICLMHTGNYPFNIRGKLNYEDVVAEVYQFLEKQVKYCEEHGIAKANIFIDPGFGFGKKLEHNLALLNNLHEFSKLGCGILVGMSRKGMLGQMINRAIIEDRIYAHVTAVTLAVLQGADIIRTHDIMPIKDACGVIMHMANIDKTEITL
jgi:dihydropteroate synthase